MQEKVRVRSEAIGLNPISPLKGAFLQFLVDIADATRVLEIGCGIGYSTSFLLLALPSNGLLVSVGEDKDHVAEAEKNLAAMKGTAQLRLVVAKASHATSEVTGPFDMIFWDVEPRYYPALLDDCKPLLRESGFLVADNIFYQEAPAWKRLSERDHKGIQTFVRKLRRDPKLSAMLLPLGASGALAVALKKE